MAVPIFGGEAESFPSYAMQVELWGKATNLDVCKRATVLVLQLESNARDARRPLSNSKLSEPDGAGMSLPVPRDCLAPDAPDGA